MSETLKITDFGPIKEATIEIRRFLLLIGTQASGKSTVAKLLAIFRSVDFVESTQDKKAYIENYGLNSYFNDTTVLEYSNSNYTITYKKDTSFIYTPTPSFKTTLESEKEKLKVFYKNYVETSESYKNKPASEKENLSRLFFEYSWKTNLKILKQQIYIPTERILVPLISQAGFSFANKKIAIPKFLDDFGSKFEINKNTGNEFKIDFLNVTFQYEDGKNKVFYNLPDRSKFVLLDISASGFQSAIPLYVVIESLTPHFKYSLIIEEPEANLFPTTQDKIIRYLIHVCMDKFADSDVVITTHSPYILAVLNNLLLSCKVATKHAAHKSEIETIIPANEFIDGTQFNAYYLSDKGVCQIYDESLGLISDNELDDVSEKLLDESQQLRAIYKRKS